MMRTNAVSGVETRYFCKFKESKGLSEGEHLFAAQTNLQIDAEIAKKSRFRTEISYNY
jgi:hypothetical protein